MGCKNGMRWSSQTVNRSEEVQLFEMRRLKFQSWWALGLVSLLSIEVRRATSEETGAVCKRESLFNWNSERLDAVNHGRHKREGGQSKDEATLSRAIRSNDIEDPAGKVGNVPNPVEKKIEWKMQMGPPLYANIEEMKKLVHYPHWRKKLPPKQPSGRSFISSGLAKLGESIPGEFGDVLKSGPLQKLVDAGKKSVSKLGAKKDKSPTLVQRAMDLAGASEPKGGKGRESQLTQVNDEGSKGRAVPDDDRSTTDATATEKGVFEDLTGGLLGRLFG